jgi:hypothetical protein
LLEPIHAVTYFSPEPLAALKEAGYRGFWMGYFAGRAAPLGRASAEIVHAVCYNFVFEHVARAVPRLGISRPLNGRCRLGGPVRSPRCNGCSLASMGQ